MAWRMYALYRVPSSLDTVSITIYYIIGHATESPPREYAPTVAPVCQIRHVCIWLVMVLTQTIAKSLNTKYTLGKPIMMFRVNLINYLVKLHLKFINEYCIRISEILYILKCVVMIDMKTRHILFW